MKAESKQSLELTLNQLEKEYGRRLKRGDSELNLQHYREAINATALKLKHFDKV
jgi:hypothetical protein